MLHVEQREKKEGRRDVASCPPLDEVIATEIVEAISTSTDGIKRLCKKNGHWPSHETVNQWRLHYPLFADRYARAKQIQADLLVEEALDIAQNNDNDTILDADGIPRSNHAAVQRDRLIVDSIKWIACKLVPKVYGDRQQVDTNVTINHEDTLKDLA